MRLQTRQIVVSTKEQALRRLCRNASPAVRHVLGVLRAHEGEALVVGGAVRDAFLGRPTQDWDVATDLHPSRVAALFPRVVRAGEKHGTIMVVHGGEHVEVTTYRSEGSYVDARRPSQVEFHGSIDTDLRRRDFTVNAMAADLERRRLVDPCGGVADLSRGLLRCVGDPIARFLEDGLRPLRAVRFAGILGLHLQQATRAAIPLTLDAFEQVSWERKRDEMTRLLAYGRGFVGVGRLLARTGLLRRLAPELTAAVTRLSALDRLPNGEPWLRFAAWAALSRLSPDDATGMLRRWRVATVDIRRVVGWLAAVADLPTRPPRGADLRRWLSHTSAELSEDGAKLALVLRPAYDSFPATVRRALRQRPPLCIGALAVSGQDLLDLGCRGPEIGSVLKQLLDVVVRRPSRNARAALLALARETCRQ